MLPFVLLYFSVSTSVFFFYRIMVNKDEYIKNRLDTLRRRAIARRGEDDRRIHSSPVSRLNAPPSTDRDKTWVAAAV